MDDPAADGEPASGAVNPHFLSHVVETAAARGVEASEDVVAGNGIKLIAKGARIDAGMRERLLQHKLRKPLENCMQVSNAVGNERIGELGEQLLDTHALLRALCADERARDVPASMAALAITPPLRSLLTLYADSQPGRLPHAVGVAMLAMALARRLLAGDVGRHRNLALAGLLHDIGELYIDPAYLRREAKLGANQWRHIASHPVIGHRVLRELDGAGRDVAEPVLLHHERLDGFGYPRGAEGSAFTLDGQIVAAAEWLMALLESGVAPRARASLAPRLVPGEFERALLDVVAAAAATASAASAAEPAPATQAGEMLPRVERIAATLARYGEAREWLDQRSAEARPALRKVLDDGRRRMQRLQASFSSTGLDAGNPAQLLDELAIAGDARLQFELATLLLELEWRMRQLERETRLRAGLLPHGDGAIIEALIARLRGGAGGQTPAAAGAPLPTESS